MKRKILSIVSKLNDHSEIVMLAFAVFALVLANSPLHSLYAGIVHFRIPVMNMKFETFVSEFLLSFFFFSIGLELKKELTVGSLRDVKRAFVPILASCMGVLAPLSVFAILLGAFSLNSDLFDAWGIVISTDVAFSLAVLKIFSSAKSPYESRIAGHRKTFLMTVAVVDDFIGIIVIAFFYSGEINFVPLIELAALAVLTCLIMRFEPGATVFLAVSGLLMWCLCEMSGVHPELVGALVGFLVPVYKSKKTADGKKRKILLPNIDEYKNRLDFFVNLVVLPLFAFCATQIDFAETFCLNDQCSAVGLDANSILFLIAVVLSPIIGKPLGIVLSSYVCVKFTPMKLPEDLKVRDLIPVGNTAGIGFTVSFLIASIVFANDIHYLSTARIAIFIATILSAVLTGISFMLLEKSKEKDMQVG